MEGDNRAPPCHWVVVNVMATLDTVQNKAPFFQHPDDITRRQGW